MVLNPADFLRQSRDAKRLSEITTLDKALAIAQFDTRALGQEKTLYLSLVDSDATTTLGTNCASLFLPLLPSGWQYHCAASSAANKVDGTGWIPVNLEKISIQPPIARLPLDSLNASSGRSYFTYATLNGKWEITAVLEADKNYKYGVKDKGLDPTMYEYGTDATITPFANGLVGYWKFDEGSGLSVSDLSGFGNNGTLLNGPTWVGGKSGKAIHFDGFTTGNDRINVGNGASLSNLTALTMSFYFRPDNALPPTASYFFEKTGSLYFDLRNPNISLITGGGTAYRPVLFFNLSLGANNWHHLVFEANGTDANNAHVYINGVEPSYITRDNGSGIFSDDSASSLFIGNRDASTGVSDAVDGALDEIRLYRRALSSKEIQSLTSEL